MSKIITNCYSNIYVQNEVLTNTKYKSNSKMNKDYHGGKFSASRMEAMLTQGMMGKQPDTIYMKLLNNLNFVEITYAEYIYK